MGQKLPCTSLAFASEGVTLHHPYQQKALQLFISLTKPKNFKNNLNATLLVVLMEHQLDKQKIHALSSETRTKIIKSLAERRKTLSELSAELGLAASTMSEHMEVLVNSGLARKMEEGHKWKYYELTFLGKSLGHPDVRWYLMFGLCGLLVVSGFFWTLDYYSKMPLYFADSMKAIAGETAASQVLEPNNTVVGSAMAPTYEFIKPAFPYSAIVLIIFGVIGFLLTKFSYDRKTQRIKKKK